MPMPRVYLPGAEETTITQAVSPGRRHSIALRGSIPAVIPNADALPTLPTTITQAPGRGNQGRRNLPLGG